jgi:hypothetical protein
MKMNGNQLFAQSALPITSFAHLPQFSPPGLFGSQFAFAVA